MKPRAYQIHEQRRERKERVVHQVAEEYSAVCAQFVRCLVEDEEEKEKV